MLWDSPLVASTASALHQHLRGARLRAVHLEYEARRLRLHFREHTLLFLLHPDHGGMILADAAEPPDQARRLASQVVAVEAPPDDRVLVVRLRRVRGSPAEAEIVVELMTNQWNAAVTEGPDRTIRHLLRPRDGERPLRVGSPYRSPPASDREGIDAEVPLERWLAVLGDAEPRRRRGTLLSTFAWTSSLNAPELLGAAASTRAGPGGSRAALEAGWSLWRRIRAVARGDEAASPALLDGPDGPQPYPLPLPGSPGSAADTLMEALTRAADVTTAAAALPTELVEALRGQVERARGRVASLEEELANLSDPAELRAMGDLILARFQEVPTGAERVTLRDFGGQEVEVELDPSRPPDANARGYYDRAARAERAAERLPKLAAEARAAWETLAELLERAREGDVEAADIRAVLPEERPSGSRSEALSLPYRRFRSSGGLEIRVGRGARQNDDLTFHHSAPDDVWMHARHAAGAHVILRWSGEGNPPARDLAEAAVLAAVHSRARTSGTAPVDWTRRKYVRKPRKAPPGRVAIERVQTLFVEPDETLVERLRDE